MNKTNCIRCDKVGKQNDKHFAAIRDFTSLSRIDNIQVVTKLSVAIHFGSPRENVYNYLCNNCQEEIFKQVQYEV